MWKECGEEELKGWWSWGRSLEYWRNWKEQGRQYRLWRACEMPNGGTTMVFGVVRVVTVTTQGD